VIIVLELLFALTPLACWLAMARTRAVGVPVGLALAGYAALVLCVRHGWLASRAHAEVYVGHAPVALLLITAGALVERRLRGPRPKRIYGSRTGGAWIVLGAYLAFFGLAASPLYVCFYLQDSFTPATTDVLPLPPGLSVTTQDSACGTNECGVGMTIGSSSGLSPDEIAARLRTGLTHDHGWRFGPDDEACRPNGWLLDTRSRCVTVSVHDGTVDLLLNGYDTLAD
jgi:hypothetical protein